MQRSFFEESGKLEPVEKNYMNKMTNFTDSHKCLYIDPPLILIHPYS